MSTTLPARPKSKLGFRAWWQGVRQRRAARKAVRQSVPLKRIGAAGSKRRSSYYGFNQYSDPNTTDYPSNKAFFNDLRRTLLDPKIRGAVEFIMAHQVSPVHEAYFRPRGRSKEAIRNADFMNQTFGLNGLPCGLTDWRGRGRFEGNFAASWRALSSWILNGFSLTEELYKVEPDGGGTKKVWLRDLRSRWGGHLEGWHDDEDGRIVAATLRYPGTSYGQSLGTYRLPIRNDAESAAEHGFKNSLHIAYVVDDSSDPNGRLGALLRACSGPRRLKEHAYNQLGIGLLRWGNPIPKATIDLQLAEALALDPDTIAEAKSLAERAMENLSSDAGQYAVDSGVVSVSEYGGNFDPKPIVDVINMLNHEALTTLFMHWLAMGVAQSHGSGAAAITHGNAVLQVSRALSLHTRSEFERQTVKGVLEVNFGAGTPVPEMVLPGIDPNPFNAVNMPEWVRQGMFSWGEADERWARQQVPGMPTEFEWQGAPMADTPPVHAEGGRPEGSVIPLPTEVRAALVEALARFNSQHGTELEAA